MYELKLLKQNIRKEYIKRRREIPSEQKQALDRSICEHFLSLVTYRFADTLLLYYPTASEVDILPIAQRALAAGKRVAFPRCIDGRLMDFRIVTSVEEVSEKGLYSIPEPSENLPLYDISGDNSGTVCLIPALIYDRDGFRLGYGKGYYDRYLSSFGGKKVGIIYSNFIVDSIPKGKYDLSVDLLITEKGVKLIGECR